MAQLQKNILTIILILIILIIVYYLFLLMKSFASSIQSISHNTSYLNSRENFNNNDCSIKNKNTFIKNSFNLIDFKLDKNDYNSGIKKDISNVVKQMKNKTYNGIEDLIKKLNDKSKENSKEFVDYCNDGRTNKYTRPSGFNNSYYSCIGQEKGFTNIKSITPMKILSCKKNIYTISCDVDIINCTCNPINFNYGSYNYKMARSKYNSTLTIKYLLGTACNDKDSNDDCSRSGEYECINSICKGLPGINSKNDSENCKSRVMDSEGICTAGVSMGYDCDVHKPCFKDYTCLDSICKAPRGLPAYGGAKNCISGVMDTGSNCT